MDFEVKGTAHGDTYSFVRWSYQAYKSNNLFKHKEPLSLLVGFQSHDP